MFTLFGKCYRAARRFEPRQRGGALLTGTVAGAMLALLGGLDASGLALAVHDAAHRSAGCAGGVADPAGMRGGTPAVGAAGLRERAGAAVEGLPGVLAFKSSDGNHRERTYLLRAPAGYVPTNPYTLVFVFHGATGSSRTGYGAGFQDVAGASENAIFVFPDGIKYKNTVVGWDDAGNGYDLPFFDHMLGEIEASYCIDTTRVFAAGGSWGGDFVIALACHRGAALRAVEVNSSGDEYADKSKFMTYQGMPCPGKTRPAVLFEHAVGGDGAYPAPDFATTSLLFKYLNACGTGGRRVAPHTSVMACVAYNSCTAAYTECFFDSGIGHQPPPNLPQDTWNFFSGF